MHSPSSDFSKAKLWSEWPRSQCHQLWNLGPKTFSGRWALFPSDSCRQSAPGIKERQEGLPPEFFRISRQHPSKYRSVPFDLQRMHSPILPGGMPVTPGVPAQRPSWELNGLVFERILRKLTSLWPAWYGLSRLFFWSRWLSSYSGASSR